MHEHKTSSEKHKAALAVKKASGTLSKSLSMIENDEYCPKIIQQLDAVIGLLESSKKNLLRGHLDHCLENNLKENRDLAIDELIQIFKLK